jgi:protein-S-isoprenylcysteine O-methyltransferase Ste14
VILRHLLSIAILPFTVMVVVPAWLARRHHVTLTLGAAAPELALQLVGAASIGLGLALFVVSLWQFAVRGKGTLAPWDPPRTLVVEGPFVEEPQLERRFGASYAEYRQHVGRLLPRLRPWRPSGGG